jgi:hypothetical protein
MPLIKGMLFVQILMVWEVRGMTNYCPTSFVCVNADGVYKDRCYCRNVTK